MFELTAKEIKWIDEIEADKKAADQTLKISLMFHANCMNEHHKRSKEWWDFIAEKHGLPHGGGFEIKRMNGVVCVVEIKDDSAR